MNPKKYYPEEWKGTQEEGAHNRKSPAQGKKHQMKTKDGGKGMVTSQISVGETSKKKVKRHERTGRVRSVQEISKKKDNQRGTGGKPSNQQTKEAGKQKKKMGPEDEGDQNTKFKAYHHKSP